MDFPEFEQIIASRPLNLIEAGLHFARNLAYPEMDIDAEIDRFNQLVARSERHLSPDLDRVEQSLGLANHLFSVEGEGFEGNQGAYHDPRNSYLNEVLNRRLGIPISMSVLYLETAKRLDLPAYGIGLPGHFIVGVHPERAGKEILIDPFHAGQRLDRLACQQIVNRIMGKTTLFDERWLAPTPAEMILVRMLNNLRIIYMNSNRWETAVKVIQHLRLVQPEVAEHDRDEGLVHFYVDDFVKAIPLLEKYIEKRPNASDIDLIKKGINEKLNNWVLLN